MKKISTKPNIKMPKKPSFGLKGVPKSKGMIVPTKTYR